MLSPHKTINDFLNQGYVKIPRFLDFEHIDEIAEELNWLVETQLKRFHLPTSHQASDAIQQLSRNLIALHEKYPEAQSVIYDEVNRMPSIHKLAVSDTLLAHVKMILNTDHIGIHPRLNMVMSMPEEEWHTAAAWHQDNFYNPGSHIIAYLPLQRTNPANGGLMVCPTSDAKALAHTKQSADSKWISIDQSIMDNIAEDIVKLELEKGDLLLFSKFLPHSADVNHSSDVRFAITLRYSNLEDPFFIERGWKWQDLATEGINALQKKRAGARDYKK